MKIALLFVLIGVLLIGLFVFFSSYTPQKEAETLLSWEESLGQLFIIGFEGTEFTPELASLMEEIKPGGVLLLSRNIENKEQLTKLIKDLQAVSLEAIGLSLFIAVDQEGKALSRIPFAKSAEDLKELGVNMNLAPVLDSRNRSDFLHPRSVKDLGTAVDFVGEHQKLNILAVPKHFPGYDGVVFNPEITIIPEVPVTPSTTLFEELFREFNLPFVMVSHVVYQDRDRENVFPFSRQGISWLKEKLGSGVLVMSDDILSLAFLREFSYEEIGRRALEAGIDAMIAAGYPDAEVVQEFYKALVKEVENDKVLQEIVEQKTKKIIELKKEMYDKILL